MFKKHRVAFVAWAAVAIVGAGVAVSLAQSSGDVLVPLNKDDAPPTPVATASVAPDAGGDSDDVGTPSPQAEPSPDVQGDGAANDAAQDIFADGPGSDELGTVTPQAGGDDASALVGEVTDPAVVDNPAGDNGDAQGAKVEQLGALAIDLANRESEAFKSSGLSNVYSTSVSSVDGVVYVAVGSDADVPASAQRSADGTYAMTLAGSRVVIVTGTQYPSDQ